MRHTLTAISTLVVCLCATGICRGAIIAEDGFEGTVDEIGHTVSGSGGALAVEQGSNVRTGLQSLRTGTSGGTQTTNVTFNPVPLSQFTNVGVSVWWTAPSPTAFESVDNLTIRVSHDGGGVSPIILLDVSDVVLDANNAYAEATASIPDSATTATLEFLVTVSEPTNEDIFFDDVVFSGDRLIPEPSTLSMAMLGVAGCVARRRKRSGRHR